MRFDYGYAEEKKLGKPYDLRLMSRLLPFVHPYRLLLGVSIALVVLITLLDLAVPYVTKLAIDRHIVPHLTPTGKPAGGGRFLVADPGDPAVAAVIRRYPERFETVDGGARLPLERLAGMDREDIRVLRKGDLEGLGAVAALFVVIILADFVFNFFQKVIMEYVGHRIMHDLRLRLFEHIQRLPVAFFTRNPVGRLVTRVTNDVQNMHELFTSVVALIFKDLFLFVGITVILVVMNWKLALLTFGVLPFVWLAAMRFSSQVRDVFRIQRIKVAEINTRIAETIAGIKVVQSFRKEQANYDALARLNHENYVAGMDQIHVLAVFMPVIEFLGVLATAIVIYYGGGHVLDGAISLGMLVAFISYMRMFFRPIRDLAEKYNLLQNAMASAERLFLILDTPLGAAGEAPAVAAPPPAARPAGAVDAVTFEHVSFAYLPDEPVLKDVSFSLARGETLALVGPTGSGKTTLLSLITRFYDPTAGRILVDGRDIRRQDPREVRARMALVMQDPFLFSGSIGDNIRRGRRDLTDEQIEHILELAHCREWVARLPDGVETRLGEGGGSLSSGERQLLSIARAFARDPELIILDEATSYIDSETEQRIQAALATLTADRTALIVAHRLSTARQADRIAVMHRGRLVESGSHAELMAREGLYARLTRVQG